MIRPIAIASLGVGLTVLRIVAQSPGRGPTFDVASIKPTANARETSLKWLPPNGLSVTNETLRMLITYAFDAQDFQISGGPGWVNSQRFDILAKAGRTPGQENVPDDPRQMSDAQRVAKNDEMNARIRALLADRFQLRVHRETKEGSVYALVAAKGGPKLQNAKEAVDSPRQGLRFGPGRITGMRASLQMLAKALSSRLGRPVFDKTGVIGKYDFQLEWTPDLDQGEPTGELDPGKRVPPPPDPNGPTVFTALQKQLGLRLVSENRPVEIIVIDHVEKPSQN